MAMIAPSWPVAEVLAYDSVEIIPVAVLVPCIDCTVAASPYAIAIVEIELALRRAYECTSLIIEVSALHAP